MMFINIFVVAI